METTPSISDYKAFVELVYASVLRRGPDETGLSDGVRLLQEGMDPSTYLRAVMASSEFNATRLVAADAPVRPSYDPDTDHLLLHTLTPEVRQDIASLSTFDAIAPERYNAVLDGAVADFRIEMPEFGGQEPYIDLHRTRFFELANMAAKLLARAEAASPVILDIGWSLSTVALQRLFTDAQIWTLDRPHMPMPASLRAQSVHLDLAAKSLDEVDLGLRADIIVFSEVLEHLLANPIKVLKLLLRHLKDDGHLIITTPNFFRASAVDAIARQDNPQPIFPYENGPEDAPHFHVREYCMRELIWFASEAGGAPAAFFFSGCWDSDEVIAERPQHEWSNMVMVVRKAGRRDSLSPPPPAL